MKGAQQLYKLSILLLPSLCSAHPAGSQRSRGIIGYGIDIYKPVCGFACNHVLSQSQLNCSVFPIADRWHGGSGLGFDTLPQCFATDDAYLQSIACCLQQRCLEKDAEEDWVIERFWEHQLVGNGLDPKYEFDEALTMCGDGLQSVLILGQPLNTPSDVATDDWQLAEQSMRDFALNEGQHSTYALLLLSSMLFLPLILALIKFLISASSTHAERLLLTYLIYPPVLRKGHFILRLTGEEHPPTRGQALLVFFIVLLNVLFSILGYHGSMPNIYWNSRINMTINILANRVGILSFANLTTIFIYSSRNNPLIRLTGWPYNTFIRLHRWLAYICIGQVALHSLIYFIVHLPVLSHKFTQAYWNVGVVGTAVFCIVLPTSMPFVRRRWFELFIDVHVTLAVGILFTCYYHVYFKFEHEWGYENWILLAVFIWALESFARGFKIVTNGLRTAHVLEVDDEYFVMNVEGVKGIGMAYLYFPSLGWRLWENHPFSILASVVEAHDKMVGKSIEQGDTVFALVGSESDSDLESEDEAENDISKHASHSKLHLDQLSIAMTPITPNSATFMLDHISAPNEAGGEEYPEIKRSKMVIGLSFLIRREKGTTARLFTKSLQLPVLVEGPYHSHLSLASLATTVPHLVCIAGGVGIAPILPVIRARATAATGSTRLYFGTRSQGLLTTCGLEELQKESIDLDIQVRVQERWNLEELVLREAGCFRPGSNGNGLETFIVVSGPAAMVDAVRLAVVEANKRCKSGIVRFVDESFT